MGESQRVCRLYRELLRGAKSLPQYNYREYAVGRIKHAFRHASSLPLEENMSKGQEALALIRRQAAIQRMYFGSADELVIEKR